MKYFNKSTALRRVVSLLLAVLIVAQVGVAPVAASTATASTTPATINNPDCLYEELNADDYLFWADCSDATADGYNRSAHNLETHTDIYAHLDTQEASHEAFLTVFENYRNDLDGRAWMLAERTLFESYEAGATQTEAEINVRENVSAYYTTKQRNEIDRWNTSIEALRYSVERADQQNLSRSDVFYHSSYIHDIRATEDPYENEANWAEDARPVIQGFSNETITLADGTTHGVRAVHISFNYYDSGHDVRAKDTAVIYPGNYVHTTTFTEIDGDTSEFDARFRHSNVKGPTSDYSSFAYYWYDDWHYPYDNITAQEDQTQNETEQFINNVWGDIETGEINSSDALSRLTVMEEYGLTSANGSNATFSDTAAALAAMGLDSPTLNKTGYFNVSYDVDNTTRYTHEKGMLFSSATPNGSWQAGETYHSDNVSGGILFVHQDGTQRTVNGTITIHSMTDQNGYTVDTVETKDHTYETANTTELQNMVDELIRLQGEIETYQSDDSGDDTTESSVSGGFLSDWFGGLSQEGTLVVIIGAAGALLLGKDLLN